MTIRLISKVITVNPVQSQSVPDSMAVHPTFSLVDQRQYGLTNTAISRAKLLSYVKYIYVQWKTTYKASFKHI